MLLYHHHDRGIIIFYQIYNLDQFQKVAHTKNLHPADKPQNLFINLIKESQPHQPQAMSELAIFTDGSKLQGRARAAFVVYERNLEKHSENTSFKQLSVTGIAGCWANSNMDLALPINIVSDSVQFNSTKPKIF